MILIVLVSPNYVKNDYDNNNIIDDDGDDDDDDDDDTSRNC